MMIRVLLVDDHEIFRLGLKAVLEKDASIKVVGQLASGAESIDQIARLQPGLLVLDYSLPGLSGLDVLSLVKRRYPEIKVILLTASTSESILSRAIGEGVDGLILKQEPADEVRVAIGKVQGGERYISAGVKPLIARFDKLLALTRREQQVLQMIAAGYRNKEIAEKLELSPKTVDSHRTNLMRKLDLHSLVDIVDLANSAGLIDRSI